jgi:hypothetical protein
MLQLVQMLWGKILEIKDFQYFTPIPNQMLGSYIVGVGSSSGDGNTIGSYNTFSKFPLNFIRQRSLLLVKSSLLNLAKPFRDHIL